MQPTSPDDQSSIAPPHPLAIALIARLWQSSDGRRVGRVLDFAIGSGRNGAALRRRGFDVESISDACAEAAAPWCAPTDRFAAAISTHGFLHGRAAAVAARLESVAARLRTGAPFYAVFGSTHDIRFGRGEKLDERSYAPLEGSERGIPHAFFTQSELEALLAPSFDTESLLEHSAEESAGTWAHPGGLPGAFHWFSICRRR